MTRIAFYVRVSTKGDKQNYKRQIEELHDYVGSGYELKKDIDVYKEKQSGYDDDRAELNKLIKKIEEDSDYYSCVYITEISRLGRSPRKIRKVLYFFEDNKVNLFIKKGGINLLNESGRVDGLGRIVLDIMINLADEEAKVFKERSRSGILSSMRAGKVGGGKFKAYGYVKGDNKMMIIDEEEAETVQTIYELYKAGNGTKVIAGILNEANIPTRSNKSFSDSPINSKTGKLGRDVIWSDKTVDDILKNPIYKGERRYFGGKENRKNKVEPQLIPMLTKNIIEPSIWDECMEIRKTKSHRNYITSYTYLLKDRIVCGCCGRNYFAKFKPKKGGDKVYVCSSRLIKQGNCGNKGVNISLIESAIFCEIVNSHSILKHLNSKDDIKNELDRKLKGLIQAISSAEKDILDIDDNIESTLTIQIEAKKTGNATRLTRLEKRINSYEEDLKKARKRLSVAKRKLVVTQAAVNNRSNLETTTQELLNSMNNREQLRSIYLQIIDKVIINSIDNDTILATVFISLDGVVLPTTLKLFLDISGIRKKKKSYRYLPMVDFIKELEYDDNNILKTSLDQIKKGLTVIDENVGLIDEEYVPVPDAYILTIPIEDSASSK